ncbi:unnamed protein product [Linum trigynum]|uniref:Uncharacterized protein n=1 Tax=Linum trigynum TaxID=586398 RepID=A0AAV2D4W7_9ROSI
MLARSLLERFMEKKRCGQASSGAIPPRILLMPSRCANFQSPRAMLQVKKRWEKDSGSLEKIGHIVLGTRVLVNNTIYRDKNPRTTLQKKNFSLGGTIMLQRSFQNRVSKGRTTGGCRRLNSEDRR